MAQRTFNLSAAILAVTKDGKILTATRRHSTILALPGGKLDGFETLQQTAIRETFEETGVAIEEYNLIPIYGAVVPGRDGRDFYCQTYAVLLNGTSKEITIPGGIEEGITAGFHTPMELLCKGTFVQYNAEAIKMALMIEQFKERFHG